MMRNHDQAIKLEAEGADVQDHDFVKVAQTPV